MYAIRSYYDKWKNHIFKIIYDSIAIPNENVDIKIKMEGDKVVSLDPWITPFDVTSYDINEIKLMYSDYRYLFDRITSYNVCYTKLLRDVMDEDE